MDDYIKNLSEEKLISLIKEGNHRYFSVLSARYETYILNKCKSYVKDQDVTEDLCQEVLIKIFLQLPKFREEAKFKTWLYTIIHNVCIDYLRKNNKKTRQVITDKIKDEITEITDFDEVLPLEKTEEVLFELLEQLTPEEKLILILKYKEKHHIKDISLSLRISESALKMRLKRAKEKLNQLYEKQLVSINLRK